jgi:hypothetical protein
MKLKNLFTFTLLIFCLVSKSQEDSLNKMIFLKKNSVFLQIGGISFVSAGYARNFKTLDYDIFQLKYGVSYGHKWLTGYFSEFNIIKLKKRKKDNEYKLRAFGAGISLLYEFHNYSENVNMLLKNYMFTLNFSNIFKLNNACSQEIKLSLNLFIIPDIYAPKPYPSHSYPRKFSGIVPFPMISYTINLGLGKK